jgi:hypothetical protein
MEDIMKVSYTLLLWSMTGAGYTAMVTIPGFTSQENAERAVPSDWVKYGNRFSVIPVA